LAFKPFKWQDVSAPVGNMLYGFAPAFIAGGYRNCGRFKRKNSKGPRVVLFFLSRHKRFKSYAAHPRRLIYESFYHPGMSGHMFYEKLQERGNGKVVYI